MKRYGEVDDNTRLTFDEAWEFQKRMEGKNSTVALSINADFAGRPPFSRPKLTPTFE